MTKGEYRVGTGFNPSGDDLVGQIKRKAAELIDPIDQVEVPSAVANIARLDAEVARCKSVAQTAIEDGAMWAVKAATKPAPVAD